MAKIQRGNVVLHIEDFEVSRYLGLGYNVVDNNGNVLEKALPHDYGSLQKQYLEQNTEIAQLKLENERLTAENTALKAQLKKQEVKSQTNTTTNKKSKT